MCVRLFCYLRRIASKVCLCFDKVCLHDSVLFEEPIRFGRSDCIGRVVFLEFDCEISNIKKKQFSFRLSAVEWNPIDEKSQRKTIAVHIQNIFGLFSKALGALNHSVKITNPKQTFEQQSNGEKNLNVESLLETLRFYFLHQCPCPSVRRCSMFGKSLLTSAE